MDTQALYELILNVSEDFKAVDLVALRVSEVCEFADYFIIMSGTSSTHIKSLAEELAYKTKHADRQAISIEGLSQGEWCLLDFGDIVVHVFDAEKRAYYNLEELWSKAQQVFPEVEAVETPATEEEAPADSDQ